MNWKDRVKKTLSNTLVGAYKHTNIQNIQTSSNRIPLEANHGLAEGVDRAHRLTHACGVVCVVYEVCVV
jgi:hypothetical protein